MMTDKSIGKLRLICGQKNRPYRLDGRQPHLRRAPAGEETKDHLLKPDQIGSVAADCCKFPQPGANLQPALSMGGDYILDCYRDLLFLHGGDAILETGETYCQSPVRLSLSGGLARQWLREIHR